MQFKYSQMFISILKLNQYFLKRIIIKIPKITKSPKINRQQIRITFLHNFTQIKKNNKENSIFNVEISKMYIDEYF